MPVDRHSQGRNVKVDGFTRSLDFIFNTNLKSLMIRCPLCGQKGLVMTKWIKGRKLKPLYVFHKDNGRAPRECCLRELDSEGIRDNVEISRADLEKLLTKVNAYILFSGGVDSLCTLLYLLEISENNGRKLTALHIDTTAGFPEVTEYVRRICRTLGVPLEVVRPAGDYFEMAKRWGIPSFSARWCCKQLKVKPARDFLSKIPDPKIVVDGIRSSESTQRSTYLPAWYHPAFQCLSISPILRWSHREVRSYIDASGLPPNPAKELGCSAECWCGAYKTRGDFEKLLEVHPEIFDKLVEVERAQRGRFTFIYENGNQVPLESLKRSSSFGCKQH